MKKITYLLALLFTASIIFIGCDDPFDPGDDPIIPEPPTEYIVVEEGVLNQTVYADTETSESTVRITTAAPWHSWITELRSTTTTETETVRSAIDWLYISPERGEVGTYTIALHLTLNTTGENRTAVISIASGNAQIDIHITQKAEREDGTIVAAGIELNKTAIALAVGNTETLIATVLPENANQNVVWESNNPDVATVDNNGTVTAVSEGTTIIFAVTEDGTHSTSATVSVFGTTDEGVVIHGIRWATRNVAAPGTFAATPESAGMLFQWNRRTAWDNTTFVNWENPLPGWDSTNATGTTWERENDPCPTGWRVPTRWELDLLGHGTWTTINGRQGWLLGEDNHIFLPAAGSRDTGGHITNYHGGLNGFYWTSTPDARNEESIIKLWFDHMGGSTGTPNPRSWAMSIRCVEDVTIPVTDVTIERTPAHILVGGSVFLIARVEPFNATNQAVTWTNSNPEVATIDAPNLRCWTTNVTGVSVGTTTLTATTACGTHVATSTVTVGVPTISVIGVTLNSSAITLAVNETYILAATVFPENATNQNIMWSSSNHIVASVDATGRVTAVSQGTATISVTTEDGNRTAMATVTVMPNISTSLDGVVINGIRWATRNVNTFGTFADAPESFGMLYQWNRPVAWDNTTPATWGNPPSGWSNTNATGSTWERVNDPCPAGWRVPTSNELRSLNNSGRIQMTRNGVRGHLFGAAPNQIFLPSAGSRARYGTIGAVGNQGNYWSSCPNGVTNAWHLFLSHSINSALPNHFVNGYWERFVALSIRCVAE